MPGTSSPCEEWDTALKKSKPRERRTLLGRVRSGMSRLSIRSRVFCYFLAFVAVLLLLLWLFQVVLLDDFFVTEPPKLDAEIFLLPIVRTAREELGREIVTNMVALGAAARALELKGMMKPESVKKAILNRVPKGTEELNTKAFEAGYRMMKDKK